jgi:hypothetical protein
MLAADGETPVVSFELAGAPPSAMLDVVVVTVVVLLV